MASILLSGLPAFAGPPPVESHDIIEMTRTVGPGEIVTRADIRITSSGSSGALVSLQDVVGMTARRLLIAGRPLTPGDVGPPLLVRRNSYVTITYVRSGLTIATSGRALSDGANGDAVRVMNLASRTIVPGVVTPDGLVAVGEPE